MANGTISEKLAAIVQSITYDKLPESTVRQVKMAILDLFGAYFAGYALKSGKAVKEYIASLNGTSGATFWGTGAYGPASEVAFANTAVSHVTVFDDMHAASASHYGSMVVPAGLAVAEERGSGGKDLIVAMVSGYEAGIRVGTATFTPYFAKLGFRPSGSFGAFATASTTGRLIRLNHDQMTLALGLAANFGVGLMAFANEGTDDLMYQNAFAARNGVLAAILARNGASAPRRVFEIEGGYCMAYAGTLEGMDKIGEEDPDHYKIDEVYFKAIPSCAFVQSAAQAALRIIQEPGLKVEDIEKINVRIFPQGKHYPGVDFCGPYKGIMQAQMSNPFTIASILVNGRIRFEDFTRLDDHAVESLAAKINIMDDEEAAVQWPVKQLAKVEMFMKDGSRRKAVSENPQFLDEEGVLSKFRTYAAEHLGSAAAEEFIATVQGLENVSNIADLIRIIPRRQK